MLSPPPKKTGADWEPWDLINFSDTKDATRNKRAASTNSPATTAAVQPDDRQKVAELANATRQEAYRAGFDSGRTDGLKEGRETAQAEARKLAADLGLAISRFDSGVEKLEQAVADELLALAIEIARKVVHQTIGLQPKVILHTIREALAQMPAHHAVIRLNAEDALLVRANAGEQLTRAGHRIHEDAQLGRGDVVIEVGGAHLDCRLATRWQRVLAALDHDEPWLVAEETDPS